MEEDYYKRLGIKYNFKDADEFSFGLSMYYFIGVLIATLEIVLAFIHTTHYLGFAWAVSLVLISGLGVWYLSKIPTNPKQKTCLWIPRKPKKKCRIRFICLVLQMILLAFVLVFIFVKLINFTDNPRIRKFPETWHPPEGWAMVKIDGTRYRTEKVKDKHLYTINHFGMHNTNDIVEYCIKDPSQGRIQYHGKSTYSSLYHVNYASFFFGFVDDMTIEIVNWTQFYIETKPEMLPTYLESLKDSTDAVGVQIHSNLRIGKSDFGVNPDRIQDFYKCLNQNIDDSLKSDYGKICAIGN